MKRFSIILTTLLLSATILHAQDTAKVATPTAKPAIDTAKHHKTHSMSFTIGHDGGFQISTKDTTVNVSQMAKDMSAEQKKKEKKVSIHWGMLDLGINVLQDKTNYASAAAQNYLQVPAAAKNSSLFDLRTGKSVNVNIYPIMFKYRMLRTKGQIIYLNFGLSLQLYNFRYDNPLVYKGQPNSVITEGPDVFRKNKMGLDYLSVPLMLDFKTRMGKDTWFVYGFGITGGLRIASWTKQESREFGKVKLHDPYDFNDVNSCLTAEIGVDGYIRLYASYQLTNLYKNSLDQHPFAIGVRFLGI